MRYYVNQEALCNQQASNHSIGHKWLEFPGTKFHNCALLFTDLCTSEIGRDKFRKLVDNKFSTVVFCTLVRLAEIRCHLNQGSALFNQDASNRSIGFKLFGSLFSCIS